MKKLKIKRSIPIILAGIGTVGVIATTVMTAKATIKATELIEKAEAEKDEKLTTIETIKTIAPVCIPTIAVGVATIGCVIGSAILSRKQQAALIGAYNFLDQSYKSYRRRLIEMYGKDTHDKIVEAIAAEKAQPTYIHANTLFSDCTQYLEEDYSEPRLFYDTYCGRYFEAPLEQVLMAEYHLNRNYVLRGYAVLNEFYDFLGLENTDYGADLGWIADGDDGIFWIDFNHRKVVMDDGLECYIIECMYEPGIEWQDYYL